MTETPDVWLAVKISTAEESILKIFATWYGGYLGGDSWRLNSGVKKIEIDGDFINFHGYSGSVYRVHKDSEGTSGWTGSILGNYANKSKDQGITFEILNNFAKDHLQSYQDLL